MSIVVIFFDIFFFIISENEYFCIRNMIGIVPIAEFEYIKGNFKTKNMT
jgi:hypothetical protein